MRRSDGVSVSVQGGRHDRSRARLIRAALALSLATLLFAAPAANAADVTFGFDSLADGTEISNQFASPIANGFKVGDPAPGFAQLSDHVLARSVPAGERTSSPNVAEAQHAQGAEFCAGQVNLWVKLEVARQTVSFQTSIAPNTGSGGFGGTAVRSYGYTASGEQVDSDLKVVDKSPTAVTLTTSNASKPITFVRVNRSADPQPGCDDDLRIDNLSFEDLSSATLPPPDFQLGVDQPSFTLQQGQSIDVFVRVVRQNGSQGAIDYGVEPIQGSGSGITWSYPDGMLTNSNNVRVRFTASPDAQVSLDTPVSIVGYPESASSGPSMRKVSFEIDLLKSKPRPVCTPRLNLSQDSYEALLCDMPDFDQRRAAGSSIGAADYSFAGLAADGDCHCVPTSFTNVLGYYAANGLTIAPENHPWDARDFEPQDSTAPGNYETTYYPEEEAIRYDATTSLIGTLGATVVTTGGACGTSFESVVSDADKIASQLNGTDIAFTYSFLDADADANTPRDWADTMAMGGTVILAHYGYPVFTDGEILEVGIRRSGHAVSLRGVDGTATQANVLMRDPADDEFESGYSFRDRFRQSDFTTTVGTAALRQVMIGGERQARPRWQLGPVSDAGNVRLIRSWMAFWPQLFVSVRKTGFSITGQNIFGQATRRGGAGRRAGPINQTYDVKGLVDATYVPQSAEVVYATKGGSKLQSVHIPTGDKRTVGKAPAGVADLDTDALRGKVLALGKRELLSLDTETGKAISEKGGGARVAYDPAKDRVGVLSTAGKGKLSTLDAAKLLEQGASRLPGGVLRGKGAPDVAFDESGRLLIRGEDEASIAEIKIAKGGDRLKALKPTKIAGELKRGEGMVATDNGTTLTVIDGALVEIGPNGEPVPNSNFTAEVGRGSIVSIIRTAIAEPPGNPKDPLDQRFDGDPDMPEYATDPTTIGPGALPSMSDAAADALFAAGG